MRSSPFHPQCWVLVKIRDLADPNSVREFLNKKIVGINKLNLITDLKHDGQEKTRDKIKKKFR